MEEYAPLMAMTCVVLKFTFGPWLLFHAIETLTGKKIALTWDTWLAALLLMALL